MKKYRETRIVLEPEETDEALAVVDETGMDQADEVAQA